MKKLALVGSLLIVGVLAGCGSSTTAGTQGSARPIATPTTAFTTPTVAPSGPLPSTLADYYLFPAPEQPSSVTLAHALNEVYLIDLKDKLVYETSQFIDSNGNGCVRSVVVPMTDGTPYQNSNGTLEVIEKGVGFHAPPDPDGTSRSAFTENSDGTLGLGANTFVFAPEQPQLAVADYNTEVANEIKPSGPPCR